jgi:hypothetical protein
MFYHHIYFKYTIIVFTFAQFFLNKYDEWSNVLCKSQKVPIFWDGSVCVTSSSIFLPKRIKRTGNVEVTWHNRTTAGVGSQDQRLRLNHQPIKKIAPFLLVPCAPLGHLITIHRVITHGRRVPHQARLSREKGISTPPHPPAEAPPLQIPGSARRGRRDGEEPGVQGDAAVAAGLLLRRARRRGRPRRRHGRSPSSLVPTSPLPDLWLSPALPSSRLIWRFPGALSVCWCSMWWD